jgi:hypothetical protein
MKEVTIKIPDNKYSFVLELLQNLGIEHVNVSTSDSSAAKDEQKSAKVDISTLRGKLCLTTGQYQDFEQYIQDSRNEWERNI